MPVIKGLVKDENDELASNILVRAYRNDNGVLLDSGLTGPSDEVAGDLYYDNVSLLLHFDGTDGSTTFTDNSPSPKTVMAYGNAHIETDQSKFGGASGAFDGSGDYLQLDRSLITSAAWTVEGWVYKTSSSGYQSVFSQRVGNVGMSCGFEQSTNKIFFYSSSTGNALGSSGVAPNTWTHVAWVYDGVNSIKGFVDGVQVLTDTGSPSFYASNSIIGASNTGLEFFAGYIDELRVSIGTARYTTNFTPPTTAFLSRIILAKSLGQYQIFTEYTSDVNVIVINPLTGVTTNNLGLKTIPMAVEAISTDIISFKSLLLQPIATLPLEADVRKDILFGIDDSKTGSLIVPLPSLVNLGTPTDNTVGTAVLTANAVKAAIWDVAVTSLNVENSIGAQVSQLSTISSVGAQIAALE